MSEREPETDAVFVAKMRLGAEMCPSNQFLSVAPSAVTHLCDLAERQIDVRAAQRTLIQRAETAERELAEALRDRGLYLEHAGESQRVARQIEAERDAAQALASELAAALSTIREMCGCNDACCPICHLAAHGSAPGRPTIDAMLATDAAKAALARREREGEALGLAGVLVDMLAKRHGFRRTEAERQLCMRLRDCLGKPAEQQQEGPE